MKRKRYIKLLMGIGIQRNRAATMAKTEREGKTQYAESWNYINEPEPLSGFESIDELHKMYDGNVSAVMESGKTAKPGPVIVINSGGNLHWPPFDWPPQPQPVAGFLYAIDTTPKEETSKQWQKENPHTDDIVDALRYAVEAIYNQQRGALDLLHGIDFSAGGEQV